MQKAIVIDIDNTIVDTAIRKHSILKTILKNQPFPLKKIRLNFMLSKFLTETQSNYFFSILSSQAGISKHRAPLFDNVLETINWIHSLNIKIFFLSGRPLKQKKETLHELETLKINKKIFDLLLFQEANTDKKPNYQSETTFKENKIKDLKKKYDVIASIGDRPSDIEASLKADVTPILYTSTCTNKEIQQISNIPAKNIFICYNWLEIKKSITIILNDNNGIEMARASFTDQYSTWLKDLDGKCTILVTLAAAVAAITGKIILDNNKSSDENIFFIFPFILSIISMIYSIRAITSRHTSGLSASKNIGIKLQQWFSILFNFPEKWKNIPNDAIDEYEKLRKKKKSVIKNSHYDFFYSRYDTYDTDSLKNLRLYELRASNYSKLYAERLSSQCLIWSIYCLVFAVLNEKFSIIENIKTIIIQLAN